MTVQSIDFSKLSNTCRYILWLHPNWGKMFKKSTTVNFWGGDIDERLFLRSGFKTNEQRQSLLHVSVDNDNCTSLHKAQNSNGYCWSQTSDEHERCWCYSCWTEITCIWAWSVPLDLIVYIDWIMRNGICHAPWENVAAVTQLCCGWSIVVID